MRIFLVGFMGVGKSTLGALLADDLSLPFIDLDDKIIEKAGTSIPEIFKDRGESHFRLLERQCLLQLIQEKREFVLATGGGLPCHFDNLAMMDEAGLTVYLKAPAQDLTERLSRKIWSRPMLAGHANDLETHVRNLLSDREAFYDRCALSVEMDLSQLATENAEALHHEILKVLPQDAL